MSAAEVALLLGTFSALLLAFGFTHDYIQEKKNPGGNRGRADKR